MPTKDECLKVVRAFAAKYAIEATDENVIATIHIMNKHVIDASAALDQSSRSANDHGIDAWHYDPSDKELFVYQSKLSDSRTLVASGFGDLGRAREWIEGVLVNGRVEQVPADNPCLFNLYTRIASVRPEIRRIQFVLVSRLEPNSIEDLDDFGDAEKSLAKSSLNRFIAEQPRGRLRLIVEEYDLDHAVPRQIKTYSVERIPNTRLTLRSNAHLDLAYLNLFSLVQLYRQRGDVLFDKNVRLSLINSKEARDRLVNPMEKTLQDIVEQRLSPTIFAFYHIGVTIAASASVAEDENLINLEAPSIINGCQTIVISNEFLKRLERKQAADSIERFKQIKVIAKVVVGTTADELKEITNANNRQNPIENWQLFSNESIHIEIEAALKDMGIFYERQKGKFDSIMKNADNARHYYATNGTYIRVLELAQVVSLALQNIQPAAKPSDVFINKETHDKCFDKYVVRNPRDIVFCWNLHKALKRGLNNYLELPTHVNTTAPVIFRKPVIRAHVFSLGLLYYYQSENRRSARQEYSSSLHKIANTRLVDEVQEVFYQKIVTRTRQWYTEESKGLEIEVAARRMKAFFDQLAVELGVDEDGLRPFTQGSIDWSVYGRE